MAPPFSSSSSLASTGPAVGGALETSIDGPPLVPAAGSVLLRRGRSSSTSEGVHPNLRPASQAAGSPSSNGRGSSSPEDTSSGSDSSLPPVVRDSRDQGVDLTERHLGLGLNLAGKSNATGLQRRRTDPLALLRRPPAPTDAPIPVRLRASRFIQDPASPFHRRCVGPSSSELSTSPPSGGSGLFGAGLPSVGAASVRPSVKKMPTAGTALPCTMESRPDLPPSR